VEDQFQVLGIERFDVLFVHDPPAIAPTLAPGGTLEGLEKARERGWVDFVGYGMRPHDFHLEVLASGRTDVLLCFSDYNLLRQSAAEQVLPQAAARNLGVLNGWSILRGWLTGTPLEKFAPQDKWNQDQQRAAALRLWCQERGVDLLELAIQFCLREERIHGNPIGSLNAEQLERNVEAARTPVPDEVFAALREAGL
jgi:D-threo-aldose 1-dehydrogenase